MKRFWQSAVPVVAGDGFGVSLDGKPVRLPGGAPLAVPSRPLAEAIATEWQDAGKTVMPDDLPLTRLAGTAIERIAPDPEPVRASLLAYGGSDLLCYRAEA
ncbi:MAG TPA: ATP12 family chaperone protein, partial [Acidiphilium sp.]